MRAVSYGTAADADVRIDSLRTGRAGGGVSYEAVARGRRLGEVTLQVPGAHNARNSAAVIAAGLRARRAAPRPCCTGSADLPGRAAALRAEGPGRAASR